MNSRLRALFLLAFLSGAAGLLYEIVWARLLAHTLGSTAQAVASVLAAFFGGLAAGAAVLGRRAGRSQRPLLLYATLEAVIGAYALAFPFLERGFREFVLAVTPAAGPGGAFPALARFLGVFVLLLPATAAMGGTIPVLCRLAVRAHHRIGARIGALYAVNTLGGTAGCLLAGFLTIRFLGVATSLRVGAVFSFATAVSAAWLARRGGRSDDSHGPSLHIGGKVVPLSRADHAVLAAFAVSGFTALGYEILWTRVLVLFVKSITYGFSLMLATLLLGLVAGSAIASAVADRRRLLLPLFAAVELGAGAAAFGSIRLLLTHTGSLYGLAAASGDWVLPHYLGLAILIVATILPAGILLGATFPLAVRSLVPRVEDAASRVGLATTVNTAGGILGAYVVGFVLLPSAGVVGSLKTLVALNAAAALAIVVPGGRRAWQAAMGAAAVLVMTFVLTTSDFLADRLASLRPGEMIRIDEGKDVIVTVYEDHLDGGSARTLYVDGTSYTGSRFFAQRYMKMMGHLPLLLCEEKRRALVICLGTGMTLSALARHEDLEQIACAELSEGVARALPLFAQVNDGVASNPRARIEIQDGRHFLLTRTTTWDVVTLEPPPPLNAGVNDLYSEEFYRLVKSRLAPGGVICQWFPMHSQTVEEYRMALRTFAEVFPDCSLWVPVGRNSLGIGIREGGAPWTFERIARRWEAPAVRAALREIGFPTPESLVATFILDAESIRRFAGDVPLVTDDRPRLEFHDLAQAGHRFPAGWLLNEFGRYQIDPLQWLQLRGRSAGADAAVFARAREGVIFHCMGAVFLEEGREAEAARAWGRAIQAEPDNVYYRSLVDAE